jgi:hypothetical protein
MNFDDLDRFMRRFETEHDHCVLPGIFMAARLDGRGFHRLTKEIHPFDAPFDERFRDHMIAVVEHLMNGDFQIVYGTRKAMKFRSCFIATRRHSRANCASCIPFWPARRAPCFPCAWAARPASIAASAN